MRRVGNDTFLLKLSNRLPDRRATDPEFLGQPFDI